MKKSNNKLSVSLVLFFFLAFLLSACIADSQENLNFDESRTTLSQTTTPMETNINSLITEEPAISMETANPSDAQDETKGAQDLSATEIDRLIFMREEEKLARDVYLALFERWGLPVFENIARSEQTHTEAVKGLLDNYGIPDPADTSPEGVFANLDLQQMYDDLTEQGIASLSAALKVGAAIEEIDILDLQSGLKETAAADIQRVYENLLKGSENHLRAFTSNLYNQTGETYDPQYLSQDAYDKIVNGTNEQGRGGGRGRGSRP